MTMTHEQFFEAVKALAKRQPCIARVELAANGLPGPQWAIYIAGEHKGWTDDLASPEAALEAARLMVNPDEAYEEMTKRTELAELARLREKYGDAQ